MNAVTEFVLSDIQWNILLKDNAEDWLSNALSSIRPRNL